MLKKMSLYNFLSFADSTEFDFTPTKYGILSNSNVSSTGILKGAMFIGPNAAGKTNALKGVKFLLDLFKDEKLDYRRYSCIWGRKNNFRVSYIFDISGTEIQYEFIYHLNTKKIEEKLLLNNVEVLMRLGTEGKLQNIGSQVIVHSNLDADTSFLRTAAFATGNFPDCTPLREFMMFISNSVYLSSDNGSRLACQDVRHYAEDNGVDKINKYLDDFNYDFTLEYSDTSSGEGLQLKTEDKDVIYKRRTFPVPFVQYMESQGNLSFTGLFPHIIDIIEKPGMIIIDEFGNSLHNALAEKIIRYSMDHADTSQVFITSHCSNLISNSVFRPDQINLVTFKGKEGSYVKRISDYKPREAQNLEKMYLGGMFEGLPNYEKISDQ